MLTQTIQSNGYRKYSMQVWAAAWLCGTAGAPYSDLQLFNPAGLRLSDASLPLLPPKTFALWHKPF